MNREYNNGAYNNFFKGPLWKKHRKIIQPVFNSKFVNDSMDIFQKHAEILVKRLTDKINGSTFDVLHLLHDCYGDIISGK